ncbi:hypothetical protein BDP27DRAFT_1417050 [Rhodocollybia butyracea]|uniref:Uncharacterized protein n=1 Tax=Rhodocollybia butyracea TaxID=206335 RepID=A0A9P5Q203_9AGAR|nr:hypothetical protein BDP27DRAFT_1417050 [Rhodocollybia butyracea]
MRERCSLTKEFTVVEVSYIYITGDVNDDQSATYLRAHHELARKKHLNFPDWNSVDTEETLPFRKELEEKLILVEECALKLEQGNFIDKYHCKRAFEKKFDALRVASFAYSDSMEAHGRPNLVQTPCGPSDSKVHHLGPKSCGCGIQSKVNQLEDGTSQTEHFAWTEAPPPPEPKVKCLFKPCRKDCPVPADWVLLLTVKFWARRYNGNPLIDLLVEREKYGWRGSKGRDDSVNEHALTKLGCYVIKRLPPADQLVYFG